MKKFLLHTCCAPCAGHVIEKLTQDGFDLAVFFYNPNIHPDEEYMLRKEETEKFCLEKGIEFIEQEGDTDKWFDMVRGLEKEKEGGARCTVCYRDRLRVCAKYALDNDFDVFGSTLTISPHKKSDVINTLGKEIEKELGITFYEADWKKNDGFKKACELSREHNFYRQTYCGCCFSKR